MQREEGGTPAIIGAIRAGLVFQLKQAVGAEAIRVREESFLQRTIASLSSNPAIELLGSTCSQRLPIVSFVVRHGQQYLHHNFVVAVLNDLFGIQARGGRSCAGPYGHRLLEIDPERSHHFEREIMRGCEGIKPGWVRVNFNYFISEAVFDYVLQAVHLVAQHGWRLLPDYRFDPRTGIWHHWRAPHEPPLRLYDLGYDDSGVLCHHSSRVRVPESALGGYLEEARRLLTTLPAPLDERSAAPATKMLSADYEALRWFELPLQCLVEAVGQDASDWDGSFQLGRERPQRPSHAAGQRRRR